MAKAQKTAASKKTAAVAVVDSPPVEETINQKIVSGLEKYPTQTADDSLPFQLNQEEQNRVAELKSFFDSVHGTERKMFRKKVKSLSSGVRPFTPFLIAEKLEDYDGLLEYVAADLQLPVALIEEIIADVPELKKAQQSHQREFIAHCESMVRQHIDAGDKKMLMWFLERKAGYEKENSRTLNINSTSTNIDLNVQIERATLEIEAVTQQMLRNQKQIREANFGPISDKTDADKVFDQLEAVANETEYSEDAELKAQNALVFKALEKLSVEDL